MADLHHDQLDAASAPTAAAERADRERQLRQAIYEFVRDNRPPGHVLGPAVKHPRHIKYRPLINFGRRTTPPVLLPPHAFELFLGRHLLGTVVRFTLGDWGAWPAAEGPGLPPQPSRAAAARQLLSLAREHGHECDTTSDELRCSASQDRIHRCYVAPLGRKHFCRCACGDYLK